MKKIIRPLLYILASFLLVMIVLFSVYAQRDIPVEKLKLKYAQSPSKFLPMMGMQVH
jgi:preprotein translocase subunit SecY